MTLSRLVCGLLAVMLLHCPLFASAAETWTNRQGQSMQANIVSATSTTVTFRKEGDSTVYTYPVAELSDADQKRVADFIARQEKKGNKGKAGPRGSGSEEGKGNSDGKAPGKGDGKAPGEGKGKGPDGKGGEGKKNDGTAPNKEGKGGKDSKGKEPEPLSKVLEPSLVVAKGSRLVPVEAQSLENTQYYALYFSASWCPPCRKFTPELVDSYKRLKKLNPNFEVIFISSDENEKDFASYMKDYKMPWPAVQYSDIKAVSPALRKYKEKGIPNLVFISADGEVLSASYVDGKYVGPSKVLEDIFTMLKKASKN